MEIRKKITLQFTSIVAVLLLASLMIVYLIFSSFRTEEFKNRLSNKARSIAQLISETDNIDSDLLIRIEKNNPTSLPKEKIVVYNNKNQVIFYSGGNNDNHLSPSLLNEILEKGYVYIKQNKMEILGIYYSGSKEPVFVICSAFDVFGLRKLRILGITLFTVFLFSLFVLFFLGRFFASRALSPISDVIDQVNSIDISNINTKVIAGSGTDEIALLADTFNHMMERLNKAFLTQKDFISNASHELRTPLTTITGNLEVTLLKERTGEEYRQSIVSILEEVKSLNKLTNRLLTLLRTEGTFAATSFQNIRIDDALWVARSRYLKNHKEHTVNISFGDSIKGENSFKVFGNLELLTIAFLNLIENGCKYSPDKKIDIDLGTCESNIVLNFKDKGIGIPEDEISNIMLPFYRASNVINSKGHGIGLSLVEKIITLHQGTLKVFSILHKQTVISLSISLINSH